MVTILDGSQPALPTLLTTPGSTTYNIAELGWSLASGASEISAETLAARSAVSSLRESNLLMDIVIPRLQLEIERLASEVAQAMEAATPPVQLPVAIPELALPSFPQGIKHPLMGNLRIESGEVVVEIPALSLVAVGADRTGTLEDVKSQLEELAATYLPMGDDQLTPGGRDFRDALRDLLVR